MPLTLYKSYDVILSRECWMATKNKNVFGPVKFNTITKVGVIPELVITSIIWHKKIGTGEWGIPCEDHVHCFV